MAKVYMTVFESAAEVALGLIQFTNATIDGAASSAIDGTARKGRRVRLYAESACWVAWGTSPNPTGEDDAMPLGPDNPEYISMEAGQTLKAISRT